MFFYMDFILDMVCMLGAGYDTFFFIYEYVM